MGQPGGLLGRMWCQRHAIVQAGRRTLGWRRDQYAAVPEGAGLQLVPVPEAGQRQAVLFPAQIPGLLAPALLLPYVVTLHRDQAAPLDQWFAEHGLVMQELGLGGERC